MAVQLLDGRELRSVLFYDDTLVVYSVNPITLFM